MDGRDIGTWSSAADLKFYLIAQAEIRAQRRFDEMQTKGLTTDAMTIILANVVETRSSQKYRESSPKKADDAIEIDTAVLRWRRCLLYSVNSSLLTSSCWSKLF